MWVNVGKARVYRWRSMHNESDQHTRHKSKDATNTPEHFRLYNYRRKVQIWSALDRVEHVLDTSILAHFHTFWCST